MKKTAKFLTLALALSLTAASSFAQIVVRVRPTRPREVIVRRPPPPSPAHVWVDEDWAPSGRAYAWHGGYWAAPPRPGAVYIRGHWRHTWHGDTWIPGHWR